MGSERHRKLNGMDGDGMDWTCLGFGNFPSAGMGIEFNYIPTFGK
jgi:hypothetical protein